MSHGLTLALEERMRRFEAERRNKRRLFRPGARCLLCGEDDVLVLQVQRGKTYCANCVAVNRGESERVGHHVIDRRIPLVIEVSRNEHELYNILERWRGPSFEPDPICGLPCGIVDTLAVYYYVSKFWLPKKQKARR